MNELVELAEKLGKAVSESKEAKAFRDARKLLEEHKDVLATLNEYHAQVRKIDQLEAEQKPIEVDDKHKLDELHARLISSDVFKKFTAAQMDYVDLMRKVNQAIRKHLAAIEGD